MKHVAIDLGGRESQICIRNADGSLVEEGKQPTRRLPALLAKMEPSRLVLETCSEAFRIADAARAAGHDVRIVPATLVRTLGVGARGVKNDQRDARTLSEVSCRIELPSVHLPSLRARELKTICGNRDAMIETRTKLINNVRGWMRTQLLRIRGGKAATFPDRVRGLATQHPIPAHIDRVLVVIGSLSGEIAAADKELAAFAKAEPICQLLMTAPGVGPITSLRFRAVIDDPTRFRNAHAVQSYLGLTPGERSSSDRQQRTGITKAGSSAMRRTLIQAAWVAYRRRPTDPMIKWTAAIAERRGIFIAIVALARKLSGVLYAMWRDNAPYRPTHGPIDSSAGGDRERSVSARSARQASAHECDDAGGPSLQSELARPPVL